MLFFSDLLWDVLLLLIQPCYTINATICPQILSNYTAHCWISTLPKWHLLCIINISVHFRVCQSGRWVISFSAHISFSVHPRSPRLQPTHLHGKKDEACHLLVCAEGEMTFECRAKCECRLRSCAAVRSDHCYFSCLSKEGFWWLSPLFAALK